MGLITETVKVKWNGRIKKHYEDLGYVYTKMGNEFEARIEDLTKGSDIKVKCKCDGCGKDLDWTYSSYNLQVKEDGKTYCNICGVNLVLRGEAFSKSFYDWCKEFNRNDLLARWDYDMNKCSPKGVHYGTKNKYWFKCIEHPEHKSELKNIGSITSKTDSIVKCKQCNSIAQYILDNFPDRDLYDVWDKERNGDLNPWEVQRRTNKKSIWIKCQEKCYHGSYLAVPAHFANGGRCPYCTSRQNKVHPKDSIGQYIIDNYGEEFLYSIWSDKNDKSPFEYSQMSNKKVWWKCTNGKHEDYLRSCQHSKIYEFRCHKCVQEMNNSVIEEKTKIYLKELGYKVMTEHNCTIRPRNPKTKHYLPYDNEITLSNGEHLIIEVHGSQHYKTDFYIHKRGRTIEEAESDLRYNRLKDRYKKAYAEHYGYHYLEIPYTAFQGKNKQQYKQMIDDKIEEILHDTKAS